MEISKILLGSPLQALLSRVIVPEKIKLIFFFYQKSGKNAEVRETLNDSDGSRKK